MSENSRTEEPNYQNENNYSVSFYDINGNMIGEPQKVKEGNDAIPPEAPYIERKQFIGWNPDYHQVYTDLSCYPIYDNISQGNPRIVSEINKDTTKYIFY